MLIEVACSHTRWVLRELTQREPKRKGEALVAGNRILQQAQGWEITVLEKWQLGTGVV